ncbi:hypothetical protein R4Z10_04030 [Niallia sp. XMNu-256]|uniref:hypothetical protein n=1 Tax=Niallia sp. XMNu-256 TaxID=3082444 RepID=UPI0030CF2263
MFSYVLGFPFLYFPEDKTEYIPALITIIIFSVFAYFAFRIFGKISKKEEQKIQEEVEKTLKGPMEGKNSQS